MSRLAQVFVLLAVCCTILVAADYSWDMSFVGADCSGANAVSGSADWADGCIFASDTSCKITLGDRRSQSNCLSAGRFPETPAGILVIGYSDDKCSSEDSREWMLPSVASATCFQSKFSLACKDGKVVTTDCNGQNPTAGVSDADGE